MTLVPEAERGKPRGARRGSVASAPVPIEPFTLEATSMGGRLVVHLDAIDRLDEAQRDSRRVVERIDRWAARLTRHTDTSDLSLLNAEPRSNVYVRPTLAAALRAAVVAANASEGYADITLLDARLTAEGKGGAAATSRRDEWELIRRPRGGAVVRRPPGLHFDLGGVGKGWIADRALSLLTAWPSAVVDADGDLAVMSAPGKTWEVGIDDPRSPNSQLAVLRLTSPEGGLPTRWGVATSGTSIHRWNVAGRTSHHLIDPRTGRPAETDIVQATVIAGSALRAEALAKAAVIAGTADGFALLERARVLGAVLLNAAGEVQALPATLSLLGN